MKLLAFLRVAHRDEANSWIDANIEGAGPNTFSSRWTKDGEEGLTHYACAWDCDETTKDTVVNYLELTFPGDYESAYVEPSQIWPTVASMGYSAFEE